MTLDFSSAFDEWGVQLQSVQHQLHKGTHLQWAVWAVGLLVLCRVLVAVHEWSRQVLGRKHVETIPTWILALLLLYEVAGAMTRASVRVVCMWGHAVGWVMTM